jgi:hypothetical protein
VKEDTEEHHHRGDDDVPLSEIVAELVNESHEDPVTYGGLLERFGARSHEMLLVFFTFPLCLPVPIPGVTTSLGIIATFVALLLALGRPPWLPRQLAEREVSAQALGQMSTKLLAALRRIEKVIHPHWLALVHGRVLTRVHASYLVALGLVVMLPVPLPLANMVAALPMLLVALGLLEHDGRFVVAGYLAAIPCAIFYVALILLGLEGMRQIMGWIA